MKNRGFSLLELLLVVAIVVLIGTIGIGYYLNYGKGVEISSVAGTLISDLKQAQSKAMIGEGGFKWGIHFVNGSDDYYEVFSTPVDYNDAGKVSVSTNYLPGGITFSTPGDGGLVNIIFNKISGGTAGDSVVLVSQNNTKTITVSTIGNISVQ